MVSCFDFGYLLVWLLLELVCFCFSFAILILVILCLFLVLFVIFIGVLVVYTCDFIGFFDCIVYVLLFGTLVPKIKIL